MRPFVVAALLPALITFSGSVAGGFSAGSGPGFANHLRQNKRVITVSVLIDQNAPAQQSFIVELLSAVSEEYRRNVNIEFKVVEFLPYSGDLTLYPIDQALRLRQIPTAGEIRIIFSNQTGREDDLPLALGDRSENLLAGSSHDYFGHIILYNVEKRARKKDRAGNPALLTSLKHEVAHLFGVGHSTDRRSFMYTPSSLSYGRWTEDVIRQVLEHRDKRWFPHA